MDQNRAQTCIIAMQCCIFISWCVCVCAFVLFHHFLNPHSIFAESALHPHPYLPPLSMWGCSYVGAVIIRLSPSLNTPGSRASTASAAAVLAASSRTRHHKSLSTSAHPSPPDLHAHRPRQVAAKLETIPKGDSTSRTSDESSRMIDF